MAHIHIVTRTSGLDDGDVEMLWRFHLNSWSLKVMMNALMQTGCPERWFDRVSIEPPVHQLQTALSYALMTSERSIQMISDDYCAPHMLDLARLMEHYCAERFFLNEPNNFQSTSSTFFASLVSFNIQ